MIKVYNDLIEECKSQGKNIILSKTGEGELLIYTKYDDVFNNLIIDEDGDVEFMQIPSNWRDTYNEYYYYPNLDYKKLVSML